MDSQEKLAVKKRRQKNIKYREDTEPRESYLLDTRFKFLIPRVARTVGLLSVMSAYALIAPTFLLKVSWFGSEHLWSSYLYPATLPVETEELDNVEPKGENLLGHLTS